MGPEAAEPKSERAERLLRRLAAPAEGAGDLGGAMLVFAHPDDETIAVGGRMSRLAGGCLVQVTDGAPRDERDSRACGFAELRDYRRARRSEFCRAMELAGAGGMRCEFAEIADQEASFSLTPLARRLAALAEEVRPEFLLTHPYEGGHPDHDACAFAVHAAVEQLAGEPWRPVILEAAFYHAGPEGMVTGRFAPAPTPTVEIACVLTDEERKRKRALLACYRTQQRTLSCFGTECERFRVAPHYDFLQPPQGGAVFYDQHPWGMRSQRFCELAREAWRELAGERMPACG